MFNYWLTYYIIYNFHQQIVEKLIVNKILMNKISATITGYNQIHQEQSNQIEDLQLPPEARQGAQ